MQNIPVERKSSQCPFIRQPCEHQGRDWSYLYTVLSEGVLPFQKINCQPSRNVTMFFTCPLHLLTPLSCPRLLNFLHPISPWRHLLPLLLFFHLNSLSPFPKPNKPTFLSPNRGWFMVLRQQRLSWPDPALIEGFQLLPSSVWHLGSWAATSPGAGCVRNMSRVMARASVTQQSKREHT